ncbi:MAG TPA: hypothetical protein VNU68_34820 [Verrucomicrobiae bacterium]|nr:hypothetical protein [Verrucomicrobiae bacterium]
MTGVPVAVAEPPQAPAPAPSTALVPKTEAEGPNKFRTWTLTEKNYWHRPLRNGETLEYNTQNDSPSGYRRLFTDAGCIFALTLGYAAAFDIKGTP